MEAIDVWFTCGFVWVFAFIIGLCVGDGIKTLFCRHDYEEVYRHDSYDREKDMETGLTNGVDIGFVCKKCKKSKCVSTTFQPIGERNRA